MDLSLNNLRSEFCPIFMTCKRISELEFFNISYFYEFRIGFD